MQNTEDYKPRLLIVDDDVMVLDTVVAIFEYSGFEVWRCGDSLAALTLLAQSQPDVMLTDIRMPGMSGTDLLLKLKQDGYTFPVIVMTGYADLNCAIDAVKGGAFDFVRKPFDPEYLVQAVKKAVTHHRLLALEQRYLAQLQEEVQKKTAEIERVSQLKTEFLNNLSHEVRTPINGIVGMSSLARLAESREEMQEYLGYVEASATQLLRVINDLVTLSGIITNCVTPASQPCAICDIVTDAIKQLKNMHLRAPVVELHSSPNLPGTLVLETTLMKMAVFQLLENAMKFAPESPIDLHISYDQSSSMLQLRVCDNGPGIEPEKLQQVTGLFVQGDGSNTRKQRGLGIGLNIVDKIATFLGGGFTLASQPGKGTEAILIVQAQIPSN